MQGISGIHAVIEQFAGNLLAQYAMQLPAFSMAIIQRHEHEIQVLRAVGPVGEDALHSIMTSLTFPATNDQASLLPHIAFESPLTPVPTFITDWPGSSEQNPLPLALNLQTSSAQIAFCGLDPHNRATMEQGTGAATAMLILVVVSTGEPIASALPRLRQLARELRVTFAGADIARREPRETDQLALLMRYAANPIILSDATTLISMNEPASRLFDVTPAHDDQEQSEQIPIIERNLLRLREFLASVDPTVDVATGELQFEDPRTQESLVMAIAASHVPDALGEQTGTVSVLHDMTRSRELEQHRIRQQLFESEKLAATGRLAASIAHEINNPLEAIKNSLYLLVQQTASDDPNRQFLELAQRETERVSRIIRQMLGVSRPSVTFAPTNINVVVQEALQLLGPQLRQHRIVTTVQLDEHLPLVQASADQLKQVFLNLLLNAKEAMAESDRSTESGSGPGPDYSASGAQLPLERGLLVQTRIAHEGDAEFLAGKHVIVRIRDDGNGIPPELLPHVFEPFFSTKTDRHGTGLGLWVCQDIIKHHGGHILARSLVGRGTTFLVALPFISA